MVMSVYWKAQKRFFYVLISLILISSYGCWAKKPQEPVDQGDSETEDEESVADFKPEADQDPIESMVEESSSDTGSSADQGLGQPPPAKMPQGAGQIYYVKAGSLKIFATADENSAVVSKLKKGDRVPVVRIENEWAQLDAGGFAKISSLSSAPIGSSRKNVGWKNESDKTQDKTKGM